LKDSVELRGRLGSDKVFDIDDDRLGDVFGMDKIVYIYFNCLIGNSGVPKDQ
jgi:hypothetical protein